MTFSEEFIKSATVEFNRYKTLGEKTFEQLSDADIHWAGDENANSIAIIVKHISGNMLSRWTNFLSEDGEKSWRNRDTEFENPPNNKKELLQVWNKGWQCLFTALDTINSENFNQKVKIRGEVHSIIQAVHRQLGHYASHVGQIMLLGKTIKGEDWHSLSIPKGKSVAFNQKMNSGLS